MKDLLDIRKEIDVIDNQMLALYRQRLELASDVAAYKIANHKPVFDKAREDSKIETLTADCKDSFERQGVEELFSQIMSTSRKKQYQIMADNVELGSFGFTQTIPGSFQDQRVVYQGVAGAYSQAAMVQFFGETQSSFHVDTWRDAMEALQHGDADFAVLPIENSTAGAVTENYDLLVEYDVAIMGEQIIQINHALLGLPEANLSDITCVYSHPQALMQCDGYLRDVHPEFEAVATANTAMAAQKVKEEGNVHQAAIAGEINAKLYGLKLLDSEIQDVKGNQTRFIIVSPKKQFSADAKTVSLCFELPHEKGSLYRILSHFIFNGLNMTRIESRPIPQKQWEYRFFLDFEGNLMEEGTRNALVGLQEETNFLRILGNY
ncbi:MAG: prephenate dehydratase [Lachnospiraceae bacterium]|nr:prephenate dehydratase [Lachnospiraceae bacterium]